MMGKRIIQTICSVSAGSTKIMSIIFLKWALSNETMAEYSRQLSQRVAAYASEINQLKALVARLQRMQFGKSFAKKTERQIQKAQE